MNLSSLQSIALAIIICGATLFLSYYFLKLAKIALHDKKIPFGESDGSLHINEYAEEPYWTTSEWDELSDRNAYVVGTIELMLSVLFLLPSLMFLWGVINEFF